MAKWKEIYPFLLSMFGSIIAADILEQILDNVEKKAHWNAEAVFCKNVTPVT
jgi:hypothetical protein